MKDAQSFMQIKFSSLPWYLLGVLGREKDRKEKKERKRKKGKKNGQHLGKLADKRPVTLPGFSLAAVSQMIPGIVSTPNWSKITVINIL